MSSQEAKHLKEELEKENARLKKLLADPPKEEAGHRDAQGGEPGKLLSPSRRTKAVESTYRRTSLCLRASGFLSGSSGPTSLSSQRYVSMKIGKDAVLVDRMVTLSQQNPRYG
jgi:hypothetical protein